MNITDVPSSPSANLTVGQWETHLVHDLGRELILLVIIFVAYFIFVMGLNMWGTEIRARAAADAQITRIKVEYAVGVESSTDEEKEEEEDSPI